MTAERGLDANTSMTDTVFDPRSLAIRLEY